MEIVGIQWDQGNWPKCGSHGVSRLEIEQVLLGHPAVLADPHADEPRMRAIGQTQASRYVFLVFTYRTEGRRTWLRPVSARYMHQREIKHYEQQIEIHAASAKRPPG